MIEKFVKSILFVSTFLSVIVVFIIFFFLFVLGIPIFKKGDFFAFLLSAWNPKMDLYGIAPMLIGTVIISILALIFSLPISIGTAGFFVLIKNRLLTNFLKNLIRFSLAIPPVIYGFIGIVVLIPLLRDFFQIGSGFSILTASLLLSMLIAPTMILIFIDSFKAVPQSYVLAMDSMGANRIQKFLYVILPNSKNGIFKGLTLGLSRAIGDTLIALMVAGNSPQFPTKITDSVRTLTSHIALVKASDIDSLEFRSIYLAGIILYTITLINVSIIYHLTRERGLS
ncbi:PstC family ABC transporter permease [Thermodesulfovibrio hydrogeniphilus]